MAPPRRCPVTRRTARTSVRAGPASVQAPAGVQALLRGARVLLQTAQHAALLVDPQGRALWLNDSFARLTGVSPRQAACLAPWWLLLGNASTPQQRARLAPALLRGHNVRLEAVHRGGPGADLVLDLDVQPRHDRQGRLLGFLAVGADVSADRTRENRLRQLIDNAAAGIVVQDDWGQVVDCNPEAERLLGKSRAQLLDGAWVDPRWRTLAPDGRTLHGRELPAIQTLLRRKPLRNQLVGVELPPVGDEAPERRWLRVNTQLIVNGDSKRRSVLSSFTDVTVLENRQAELRAERERLAAALQTAQDQMLQRQQAEQALHRAHDRLQALFSMSPAGIAMRQMDNGRFVEVNEAMLAMLGYSREEFLRLRRDDVTLPEYRAEDQRQDELARSHGRYGPYEKELRHKDGRRIPVLASGMRVEQPDGQAYLWGIVQDLSSRRQLELQLLNAARTDRLTGLPNRTLLVERLDLAVRTLRTEPQRGFALFFLDFDRFKLVNDSLGHEAGDLLLREIAIRLRRTLRSGDVVGSPDDGNLVARFGGDEFVVLLSDTPRVDEAHRVAQRMLEAFAAPYFIKGKEIHSSVSIGIVMGTPDSDAQALLRNADTAMYEAKRTGRGRAVFFDLGMHTRLARALTIEEALRHAVQRRQLSLVWQPIVDLETGRIVSAEALLRWQHPELGAVSPAEFIPVAEDSGLILDIGEWVLREACRQWDQWRAEGGGQVPPTISVNLSRVQMGRPERLLDRVQEALAEHQVAHGHLQLEVTEREVMHEPAQMRALMQRLRELGVRLAMDDFGTGTSSLGCLRDYPFDVVKIDKSFLAGLHNSPDVMAVMHATVTVIENLGMTSVAEGVETTDQVALLQSIGCRFAQGYLFARPMSGDALGRLLGHTLMAGGVGELAQAAVADAARR